MVIVEAVITLIVLVLLSSIISHYVTKIPVSLIQILLGLGLALFFKFKIDLNTDWFLLLFIAPLLFNDGRDFPKRELWELRGPIFENAIWLVFITTIIGGYFVNWLVPSMPLAACFALIAILSPTDPIAVQSISKRVHLPSNILHLVSGESLINDASGLIAFKYAIAAVVTGYFSLKNAAVDFVYTALVGLIIGIVGMSLIIVLRNLLLKVHFNDVIFNVVLHILTPFIIYVIAEDALHASGVIAVVAAGIIDHLQTNVANTKSPEVNLLTNRTWDVIVYCLNGIVFLILGIELPVATRVVINGSEYRTLASFGIAFAVWVALLVIRVVWILGYELFSYYVTKRSNRKPSLSVALLAGISGVRGAITMAGILSVPALLSDGKAFPDRSLMLFIAAMVIVISLVAATIILPIISPGASPLETRASLIDKDEDDDETEDEEDEQAGYVSEDDARIFIIKSAIASLENNKTNDNERAVYDTVLDYQVELRNLLRKTRDDSAESKSLNEELSLRRVALEGKRDAIKELYREKQISKDTYWIANRRINREERRMFANGYDGYKKNHWYYPGWFSSIFHSIKSWQVSESESKKTKSELRLVTVVGDQAAIDAISDFLSRSDINEQDFDSQIIHFIITFYQSQIERAHSYNDPDEDDEEYEYQLLRLRSIALEAERRAVERLINNRKVSHAMGLHLRQDINYKETLMLSDN